MAYLPARLEWCQPSSTSGNCTASHDPPYRRIGDLGLWGSSLSSVVSVAMARGMVISSDYDQGTRSYRTSLCGVGPTVGPKNSPGSQCDNTGVVAAVQKGVSKDQSAMHLLRCLWFFTAHYDIAINIEHIPGESNCAADHLSRNRVQSFFLFVPQANLLPSPLPPELMELAVGSNPDWTLPTFRLLFSSIINKA